MLDVSKYVKDLESKGVYVYGLGKSGLSCVEALIHSKANVYAWDSNEDQRKRAERLGAQIHDENSLSYSNIGSIILSPGIPLTHPKPHSIVEKAHEHNIEVIGDIEVMGRCLPPEVRTVGITGTNGKSTTTALLGHILNECGIHAIIAGNIGRPVLSMELKKNTQAIILELSSYQIDLCSSFHPDIGVLLNITPDHIDRHGSLSQYAAVKAKMFGYNTRPIISIDDRLSEEIFDIEMELGKAPILMSIKEYIPFKGEEFKTLKGLHNLQNALAAYHVCKQFELEDDDIIAAMKTFPGLAHRQQLVRQINNIIFINDSKATNAEAAGKALSSYENIYWIIGGRSKEGGLNGLEDFAPKIKKAYVIGEAAAEFSKWLEKEKIPYENVKVLEKAVSEAYKDAKTERSEAVILLSPACASWDQFENFEHRGEVFIKLVQNL